MKNKSNQNSKNLKSKTSNSIKLQKILLLNLLSLHNAQGNMSDLKLFPCANDVENDKNKNE